MTEAKPSLILPTFLSALLVGVAIWAVAGPPAVRKTVTVHPVVARR
jgi:hypothetical protein